MKKIYTNAELPKKTLQIEEKDVIILDKNNNIVQSEDVIETLDSIKKSIWYNTIKNLSSTIIDNVKLEQLKLFILSLKDNEIVAVIMYLLDNHYLYMENNTTENDYVENILSDVRFVIYYDEILKYIPC